jgi:hypothetical protein
MTTIPKSECKEYSQYLNQFDLHNHTFGFCVNEAHMSTEHTWRHLTLEEKLHEAENHMQAIMSAAREKGIAVLAITEHPQFLFYDIPFSRYINVFNKKKGLQPINVLWGIEADIEITPERGVFLNESLINNEHGKLDEMMPNAQVVVGAIHMFREWRNSTNVKFDARGILYPDAPKYVQSNAQYHEITMEAIAKFAKFAQEMRARYPGQKRVFVYGHPWGAACNINKRAYEIKYKNANILSSRLLQKPEYQQTFNELKQFSWSPEAPISYFTEEQLDAVSAALIENSIVPEINRMAIARGGSEYQLHQGKTLIESYIEQSEKKGITPLISICSDAHCPEDLGIGDISCISNKVQNITKAKVWAEDF